MDDVSRQRVANALNARDTSQVQAVRELLTAEQLHQFVLNYNVNDGFLPILAVVEHPACDRGTALYVFWLFDGFYEAGAAAERKPEFDTVTLQSVLLNRLRVGTFSSAEIFCDPSAQFSKVQLYQLQKQGKDEFMQPVGTKVMEREWI